MSDPVIHPRVPRHPLPRVRWRVAAFPSPRSQPGLWLWGAMTVAITIVAILQPHRSISWVYRQAAEAWWETAPLYAPGLHGFLYFPTSVLIYEPFTLFPKQIESHVWRFFLSVALVAATRRYAGALLPGAGALAAGTILALATPAATVDLLRGQMTLLMMALLLAATADAAANRHGRAGYLLALAVFAKPLALVPALLITVAAPAATGSLMTGLLLGFAAGLVHPIPEYAGSQWLAMVHKLLVAATPDSGTWFDVGALLKGLGWIEPSRTLFDTRLAAAAATLALTALAAWRFSRREAVITALELGCAYLLLWNPRVEEGSYVMLALLLGGRAAVAWRTPGGEGRGRFALYLCLALGTHMYGDWIYRPTEAWIKQAVALVFVAIVAREVLLGRCRSVLPAASGRS